MSSENVTPIADSPASSDFKEEFSSDHPTANRLLAKRSSLAQMLDIGATLLRELHTPGHANWDPLFPQPIRLTANGSAYYLLSEVYAWLAARARKRDVQPAGFSSSHQSPPPVA